MISRIFVSLLIGVSLCLVAYYNTSFLGGGIIIGCLIFEGWTLINKEPNDTISETIWKMSDDMPLVPWLFGLGTGWLIESGILNNPWVLGGLLLLQGHFFFPRYGKQRTGNSNP